MTIPLNLTKEELETLLLCCKYYALTMQKHYTKEERVKQIIKKLEDLVGVG